jgi:hypothetical protein
VYVTVTTVLYYDLYVDQHTSLHPGGSRSYGILPPILAVSQDTTTPCMPGPNPTTFEFTATTPEL